MAPHARHPRLFAEGDITAAPTSEISKQAGVAEGTLFTYFKTKDDLINALYREIKLELADAMMSDFPRKKKVRTRLQHVWDRYVKWGVVFRVSRMSFSSWYTRSSLCRPLAIHIRINSARAPSG